MNADEPASPACLAHEADDAYMGFATPAEIVRFRTELEAASAGEKVVLLRKMLPRISDDRLYGEFSELLNAIKQAESKP